MKVKYLLVLLLSMGLLACASKGTKQVANSDSGVLLIQEVSFGKEAVVSDAVRRECNLPEKLAQFIKENAAGQYASIVISASVTPADEQVLKIEIENLMGSGGGAWSGAKMVQIKGVLTKNGKQLGDFKARRVSSGGAFAEFKGTCAILGRCVETLGKDVAGWLKNPTPNAVLGNL